MYPTFPVGAAETAKNCSPSMYIETLYDTWLIAAQNNYGT